MDKWQKIPAVQNPMQLSILSGEGPYHTLKNLILVAGKIVKKIAPGIAGEVKKVLTT